MLEQSILQNYLDILREELVPATGCTEPIAIAYCAATLRELLGALPERVDAAVSGNILKNVKSVVVPNTGGRKGIGPAIAVGLVAGDAARDLQVISAVTEKQLAELDAGGFGRLPVCIAKTQYSFSDDASLLAAPSGFTMTVRELRLSAGAGFVVVVMGNIMTMPGLPKKPAAEGIDVDENGVISGLF